MRTEKALSLAIGCILEVRQRHYAFDANLSRALGLGRYLRGERARRHYDDLTEAAKILEGMRAEKVRERREDRAKPDGAGPL